MHGGDAEVEEDAVDGGTSRSSSRSRMSRKLAETVWMTVEAEAEEASAWAARRASSAAASRRGRARACARGSTSKPTKARISGCARTTALAWPPAPIVPST